jgi:hypothetical protein
MATITVTEILGSDNLAGSRITINNNFKTLQNGVNAIEQRLNTSFSPGGSLNVGDALIKKYTRPLNAVIWVCEASGQVQGDLAIVGATNTTGSVTVGQALNANGNVVFANSATPSAGTYTLNNALRIIEKNGYSHEQLYSANTYSSAIAPNAIPVVLPSTNTDRYLDTTNFWNRRVIHLDLSLYTGLPTDCNVIVLPLVSLASVSQGQLITIVVDVEATSVGVPGSDKFYISSTNLDPIYTANIPLNFDGTTVVDLDNADIKKTFITFYAGQNGWKVLSAHHFVDPATY